MTPDPVQVTVHPPSPEGARRVRVNGEPVGLAHGLADIAEFLRRAGLDIDTTELARATWIDWRGAGPETWTPEPDDEPT